MGNVASATAIPLPPFRAVSDPTGCSLPSERLWSVNLSARVDLQMEVSMPSDELAEPFRRWGFLEAELDPLGRLEPYRHPTLEASAGADTARWRRIYCGPIGAEFAHLSQPTRVEWIGKQGL